MFGQYQSPAPSAAKWIFAGLVGIVLMAFGLGLNIKDAKWFNPNIAAAEANMLNIEAAHQQAANQLQERLATAQTEAEIREIQRQQGWLDAQYQHNIQTLNQDLAHQDYAFRTFMDILTILTIAVASTLSLGITIWIGSRAITRARSSAQKGEPVMPAIPPVEKRIPNLPERQPYDPWNSPGYRRKQRIAARRAEREAIAARMISFRDPAQMSTEEYNKSPEAK